MREMKLKYLRLGGGDGLRVNVPPQRLNLLLEKCPKLKALILEGLNERLNDRSIQIITTHCPDIEVAVLPYCPDVDDNLIQVGTVVEWERVMTRRGHRYLGNIQFVTLENLTAMWKTAATKFTFKHFGEYSTPPERFSIWHPFMRKLLELDW